jgi:hypothetical protein
LLLRINTVRATLADPAKKVETAKRKTPKGGQNERLQREGHDGWASRVNKLPKAGDVKNGTAGL